MVLQSPTKQWNLNLWLEYLEGNSPAQIKLDLGRITKVAQRLDLKVPHCKIITVAGTNGKGSTVNALESIYHSAGYTVGSYTSPHLIEFNERIKVDLVPVKDQDLCDAFFVIESRRNEVELSYFEMATLAALFHFKTKQVDIIILEVGMGGRLDATNIIDTDLAIITTIDFDHQDFLGDTLDAIGAEKAGILRPHKPFIYADTHCPQSILQTANKLSAPMYQFDHDFSFVEHGTFWDFKGPNDNLVTGLKKPLIQLKSAAAAIMASFLLQNDLPVPLSSLYQAMHTIFVPGRLQLQPSSKEGVLVLYDVSHNPQSAQLLANTLKTIKKAKVHAVFSILKDKDILGLINAVKDCIDYWYPAQLDNKRAASADYLLSLCQKAAVQVEICYTSPFVAFEQALACASSGDLIVVFGSFFTVGHVISSQHAPLEQKGIL